MVDDSIKMISLIDIKYFRLFEPGAEHGHGRKQKINAKEK